MGHGDGVITCPPQSLQWYVVIHSIMRSTQQKAECIIWYSKFQSIVNVKYNFWHMYGTEPSTHKTVHNWFMQYKERGSILK